MPVYQYAVYKKGKIMFRWICKILIILMLFGSISQTSLAQEQPAEAEPAAAVTSSKPPVMRSIFWNTLMGSAWGAIIGSAYALGIEAKNFREPLIAGTTLGGLVGYGFGIFLVLRGLSFDPAFIPESPLPKPGQGDVFGANWETEPSPLLVNKISSWSQTPQWKWRTTIVHIQF